MREENGAILDDGWICGGCGGPAHGGQKCCGSVCSHSATNAHARCSVCCGPAHGGHLAGCLQRAFGRIEESEARTEALEARIEALGKVVNAPGTCSIDTGPKSDVPKKNVWRCLICKKEIPFDPHGPGDDQEGLLPNLEGGTIEIHFGYGSKFDQLREMLSHRDYRTQGAICDKCFTEKQYLTRKVEVREARRYIVQSEG